MTKYTSPDFKFCPFCGQPLKLKLEHGQQRNYCPDCNWTYYPRVAIAVGALIRKNNQVLLVKRKIKPYQGFWQLPAGFVEYGEHPQTALKREVKEETGLDVEKSSFHSLYQIKDDPRAPRHLFLLYQVTPLSGSLETDRNENSDIAWHSLDNLPPIGWQAHQEILKNLSS